MSAAGSATAAALATIQQRNLQARPILAITILVAALSLVASTYLTVKLSQANADLESKNARIKGYEAELRQKGQELNRLNQQLADATLSAEQKQELAARSAMISDAIPGVGSAKFSVPSQQPSAGAQLLTMGSSTGWDIDAFWCAGANAASNYAAARAMALVLAQAASTGQGIGGNMRVGRVRLRTASAANQQSWNGLGLIMGKDNDGSEDEATKILGQYFAAQSLPVPGVRPTKYVNTPFYLSVIACK